MERILLNFFAEEGMTRADAAPVIRIPRDPQPRGETLMNFSDVLCSIHASATNLPRKTAVSFAGIMTMCALAGCGDQRGLVVTPGSGTVSLSSSPATPPSFDGPSDSIEIEGVMTAFNALQQYPSGVAWFSGSESSRALVIRTDAGVEWTLGYRIEAGLPTADVTPEFPSLMGTRVKLLFRAVRAWGSAPAFVLTDAQGLVFAMNLAVYGDAMRPGDVHALTVSHGRTLGVINDKDDCFAARHFALVFTGSPSIELPPGEKGQVNIDSRPYTAVSLFDVAAEGGIRCEDVVGGATGWAVWR
jgi:hypothetical protein